MPDLMRLLLLCAAALAVGATAAAQTPAPGDVVINEIMYDPPAPQASSNEWVEVVNRSGAPVSLDGLVFSDGAATSDPLGAATLAPGELLTLVRNEAEFQAAYPGVPYLVVAGFPALNNTGDTPQLLDGTTVIDAVPYLPSWGGTDASLERIDPDGPSDDAANFATTTSPAGGTPGAPNTATGGTGDTTPPSLGTVTPTSATTLSVSFSEALDAASAETEANYAVDGGIGAPASAVLTASDTVELTFATPFQTGQPYTLTTQGIEDAAGNASPVETADFTFFGAGDVPELRDLVLNEFIYDPPSAQDSGEYVELFNRSDKTFDLREFTLQDATETADVVTNEPVFVGPGEYVVIVDNPDKFAAVFPGVPFVDQPSWNGLNNTGDQIRLKYQGAVVDSLQYTPSSWGGSDVALERIDPNGPSSTPANWAEAEGVLGTPGAQNSQFGSDTQGPLLVEAEPNASGTEITVTLSEPLDPASVPGAFAVSGSSVVSASYDGDLTVVLALGAPLGTGTVTVTATGLRDLLGNVTPSSSTQFDFEADETAPFVASASALGNATVRLVFSEPVTSASASPLSAYDVAGQAPVEIVLESNESGVLAVVLTLATPLADGQAYTATATGLVDLAGNVGGGSASFFVGEGAVPELRDLVLNEFLYDPPSAQDAGEYVELFNRSDKTFDLREFTLQDATDTADPVTNAPAFVGPGEYAVVVQDAGKFAAVFPGVPFVEQPSWNALNNSDEQIRLKYKGMVVDSLLYEPAIWGGADVALERRDPNGPSSAPANWAEADGVLGTPGAQNSQFGPDTQGPMLLSASADRAGLVVTVLLDEPVDPASVEGAFAVSGAEVTTAEYDGDQTVTLTLAAPLPTGTVTITATDLRDTLGNVTPTSAVQFAFEADDAPPSLASAFVSAPTTVVVRFTEPVTQASAESVGTYGVEGLGMPAAVTAVFEGGGAIGATLVFKTPFAERELYTLTVTGLVDLAGNVQTEPATATLFFGEADVPATGQLVINEILYDPLAGSAGEYVELLNTTETRVFDLGALSLDGGEPDGDPVTDGPSPVPPGTHVAVVRDGEAFAAAFPGAPFVVADAFQSLSNSGAPLVLRDLGGAAVDSVFYDPDWHRVELDDATGVSLERRDPAGPSSDASNWTSSLDSLGGTPGRLNSVSVLAAPPPAAAGLEITSPFAPDEGESARIAYTLASEAALVRARIYDGGGRLVRELEAGRFGGASGSLSWDGRDDRGERLRIGIYIVLLDAVDAQGGTSESYRDVVVLARR